MLKGLETLELRIDRHCKNTTDVAHWLEKQHGIDKVIYPGLQSHPQYDIAKKQMSGAGSVLSFQLEGGKQRAFSVLNALQMIDISNNLGDTKSIVTHPATTTHQRLTPEGRGELGITDGLVRLSVGLEDPQDIKADLAQALAR